MLLLLARPLAVKGRHLHHLHLLPPRGEYVISKLCFFFILLIYGAFLRLTPHVYSFIFLLFFFFFSFLDNLSTRRTLLPPAPYYLTSPNWSYSFPSHTFSLPHVAMCFLFLSFSFFFFFLHVYLFLLPALTSAFLLSLLLFSFRLFPSPFLFITLRVRKFLHL